jgi:alkane 1-monooxygenase
MNIGKKIGFFSAFIIPALVIAGFYMGGWWNYMSAVFVFILIPLIDAQVGLDDENVPESEVKIVSEEFYYRFVTYVWTYFQVAFLLWAMWQIAVHPFTTAELMGFVIGVPLVTGGIGITVAHELGHKKPAIERLYAQILLMTVCYMHFYIEHNKGHHVHVGTPLDPATSRRGENFYAFWWRSVSGGYLSAWRLEAERLRKRGLSPYSLQNMMIWYTLLPFVFGISVAWIFSFWAGQAAFWPVLGFFLIQSVLAFTLLELVNYIEHYGILRREVAPGRYEKVNTLHSWNANQLVSNFFLFQLQRHSDHHAYAHKRYQVLRHIPESPQLPAGYPAMILLAMVPPLWFAIMDKKLDKWQQNYLQKATAT